LRRTERVTSGSSAEPNEHAEAEQSTCKLWIRGWTVRDLRSLRPIPGRQRGAHPVACAHGAHTIIFPNQGRTRTRCTGGQPWLATRPGRAARAPTRSRVPRDPVGGRDSQRLRTTWPRRGSRVLSRAHTRRTAARPGIQWRLAMWACLVTSRASAIRMLGC
jgi:hypothetical protein